MNDFVTQATSLPTNAKARKAVPLATGCFDYFHDALADVAALSRIGNEQHTPGKPLHWDRAKSTYEADCLARHFIQRGTNDTDGVRHSTKVAWRALALLQKEIETARVKPVARPAPIVMSAVAPLTPYGERLTVAVREWGEAANKELVNAAKHEPQVGDYVQVSEFGGKDVCAVLGPCELGQIWHGKKNAACFVANFGDYYRHVQAHECTVIKRKADIMFGELLTVGHTKVGIIS